MKAKSNNSRKWTEALGALPGKNYCLQLFVTGSTPKSIRAITSIKRICEAYLKGHYTLEVVDIYQQGLLARKEQIIAAPTLIKKSPLPLRKFIGDMTDTARILAGLDLHRAVESEEANGKAG